MHIIENLQVTVFIAFDQDVYKQLCSARNLTATWVSSGSLVNQGILFQFYASASIGLLQIYPFIENVNIGSVKDRCAGVEYIFTEYPVSQHTSNTHIILFFCVISLHSYSGMLLPCQARNWSTYYCMQNMKRTIL